MAAPAREFDMTPTPVPEAEVATIEEAFDQLSVPLGFRAEIINGEIFVAPPPDREHERTISRITRQLFRNGAADVDISGCAGVITQKSRCIPDITVGEPEAFESTESWESPDGLLLVAEVTSRNAERDRVLKRHRYAAADIPLYLLVDREARTVTLFSEPDVETEDYRQTYTVDYGKPLPLPEPFAFELDTSELP